MARVRRHNFGFDIDVGDEFRRVANALRAQDAALPGRLRKELRQAAKPMAAEAKRRVKAIPVSGEEGSTGLRKKVARGVGIRASVGKRAGVRITTKMAQPNEAIIPRGLDRQKGWRHPVFGNRNVWVTQSGSSWFLVAMQDERPEVARRILDVLEEARNRIAEAGGAI